jgi:predicted ATPase/DNA-binding CsgD family transcriptional regulator
VVNLETHLAPLVGRRDELAHIERLLGNPECRLLTLLGPGGIGKTRLAIHAAEHLAPQHPDGYTFVSCAPIGSADFIVFAIAEAVGLTILGTGDPIEQLAGYLSQKQMLVVMDNFDHLVEGGNLLIKVLTAAQRLTFVVTSRERLGLGAEWVFDVNGLPFTTESNPGSPEDSDAARLFFLSARRITPDLMLTEEDRRGIAHICALVEGMPLALELAASWMRVMPPVEIARQIEHNLDILMVRRRDKPDRHWSMRAAFDISWEGLSEAERAVFKNLSVFRGLFSQEAAERVAGATLSILSSLIDKSLIRYHTPGGFDLHELLRQYAYQQLSEDADGCSAAEERHSAYYADWAALQEERLHRGEDLEVLLAMDRWIRNIQAGWQYAVEHARAQHIAKYALCLSYTYSMRNLSQNGMSAFHTAVERLATQSATPERNAGLGRALTHRGLFVHQFSDLENGARDLRNAVELLRQTEDPPGHDTGLALAFLGLVVGRQGNYLVGRAHCEEAIAILRRLQDKEVFCLAVGLTSYADVALLHSDFETAQSCLEEGYRLVNAAGLKGWGPYYLALLGRTYLALGQLDRARECLAAPEFWNGQTPALIVIVYSILAATAAVLAQDGQPAAAVEVLGALLGLPLDINYQPNVQVIDSTLTDLERRLPSQQFEAALTRGKETSRVHLTDNYGLCMLGPEFSARIMAMLNLPRSDDSPALTRREAEVLQYLGGGLSNEEIAAALNITLSTVKLHLHHIFTKLGVGSRTRAITRARERGLI